MPLGLAFTLLFALCARPTWSSIVQSLPVVVGGLFLRGYASGYLSKNETLATSGPYAHVRNPLYLGSLILGVGFAWAGARWWLGATFVVLYLAIYLPTIVFEERYLRPRFPDFDAYAAAVPRLVPRPTPARLGGAGDFSRALYLKHREYNAPIGALLVYGALIGKAFAGLA